MIDDLTLGDLKKLTQLFSQGNNSQPYQVGHNYLIRTVTMIDTGRIVEVHPQEIVLEDAAWVADTGRFSQALTTLNFNEVEPFPIGKVIIGRGSIIDAVEIKDLPRQLK